MIIPSSMDLLNEIRSTVTKARDEAEAALLARNERVIKTAADKLTKAIKATAVNRFYIDEKTGLPEPKVTIAFSELGPTRDGADAFNETDLEMPTGFNVGYKRDHCFQCDCGREEGCTDFVVVTWTWE
jgi:hypothetical protein